MASRSAEWVLAQNADTSGKILYGSRAKIPAWLRHLPNFPPRLRVSA